MDADVIAQFTFGRAAAYQPPAPSVKPANHPVPPSASASASVTVPFANGRVPFFPGNHRQSQAPFDVPKTQDVRSVESFVGDSGRKSLMTEGGIGIAAAAGIANDHERKMEDEVSESLALQH